LESRRELRFFFFVPRQMNISSFKTNKTFNNFWENVFGNQDFQMLDIDFVLGIWTLHGFHKPAWHKRKDTTIKLLSF